MRCQLSYPVRQKLTTCLHSWPFAFALKRHWYLVCLSWFNKYVVCYHDTNKQYINVFFCVFSCHAFSKSTSCLFSDGNLAIPWGITHDKKAAQRYNRSLKKFIWGSFGKEPSEFRIACDLMSNFVLDFGFELWADVLSDSAFKPLHQWNQTCPANALNRNISDIREGANYGTPRYIRTLLKGIPNSAFSFQHPASCSPLPASNTRL